MADVTITDLTSQAPATNDVFPFSTNDVTPSTYKASLAQIKTAMAIPAAQIQSDWTQTNAATLDYIKNKPTIPAAAFSTMVSLATVGANLTWSKPAGITRIKVTVVGAGAGGFGQSNNAGAGGASVFDVAGINVTGGGGGRPTASNTRGAGGTATNGDANIAGAPGMSGPGSNAGGPGFGAYGVGGHGMYLGSAGGYAGGGAGGMAIKYMTVPSVATNYSYTIGAGGAASGSQGGTVAPGAGTQGIILIEY